MRSALIAAAAVLVSATPSLGSISGPYALQNDTVMCASFNDIERYFTLKDDPAALDQWVQLTFSQLRCWQAPKGMMYFLDERRAPYHYCMRAQGSTTCAWAILLPADARRFNYGE